MTTPPQDRWARLYLSPIAFPLLFLCLYTLRITDNGDFVRLATDAFQLHPDPERQFLHSSPFTFMIGHGLLRAVNLFRDSVDQTLVAYVAFACLSLGGLVAMWLAFVRLTKAHFDDALLARICLLCSPLLLIATQWVGKSDPWMMAFFFLLVTTRSTLARVLLAALLVTCHKDVGAMLVVGTVLLGRERPLGPILVGAALGLALVYAYLYLALPAPPASRADFATANMERILTCFLSRPLTYVLLSLGPFWAVVATLRKIEWRWIVYFCLALGLSVNAVDFTRIFFLLSLPLLLDVTRRVIADDVLASALRNPALRRVFVLLPFLQFQVFQWGTIGDTPILNHLYKLAHWL
jgi:hypothetical protein